MSTEHDVSVVRVGDLTPHPDADRLSIAEVGGRPVVVRTGDIRAGDLAAYLPMDTLIPAGTRGVPATLPVADGWVRIRAVRLRGVYSMGLLIPADPSWVEGQRLEGVLGTRVWEPPEPAADDERDPGFMPVYTDVQSLRRWRRVFDPDEEVVATEKIHGANARMCWSRGRLWCGSRTRVKLDTPTSDWWRAARRERLAERLARRPDVLLYGEVYGTVGGFRYGADGPRFAAFDAVDLRERRWLDHDELSELTFELGIPQVAILYRGRFRDLPWSAANGPTVLGEGVHVREGLVVRPVHERVHPELGRVIAKLVGEDFTLR